MMRFIQADELRRINDMYTKHSPYLATQMDSCHQAVVVVAALVVT